MFNVKPATDRESSTWRTSEAKMARLTAEACITCHTKSNSPEFEFASYWSKIKH